MLDTLLNNQSIERVLLFLFVNQSGYGAQIQNLLNVPLTPLQQALSKLEAGGIIQSYYEKNKRIYNLNAAHPLMPEIETLLKKVYHLLSHEEKKRYCFSYKLSLDDENLKNSFKQKEVEGFFKRLSQVEILSLEARSQKATSSEVRRGNALVLVSKRAPNELIFHEKGFWNLESPASAAFSNSFRWTLDKEHSTITLEHLRYGVEKPVFLFQLISNRAKHLTSVDPYLCNQDTYFGNLQWKKTDLCLNIRVIGPNKNDSLTYIYN